MTVSFTKEAWEQYLCRQREDKKIVERIHVLIREIQRDPFRGIGKPEPLKAVLAGYWSRRIDSDHRLVYRLHQRMLRIVQRRYHY